MRNGLHLFGSVETVADKLVTLHHMGVDHIMALQNFGLMPQSLVTASMERLMHDVMPRVQAQVARETRTGIAARIVNELFVSVARQAEAERAIQRARWRRENAPGVHEESA